MREILVKVMTKSAIQNALSTHHQLFIDRINSLSETAFVFQKNGKWSAGQQLDHINRAVSPVALAFSLPKFLPIILFGKANRPSKNYEDLVEKYKKALSKGGKASGRFIPKTISVQQKAQLTQKLHRTLDKLIAKIDLFSEEDLDSHILPHPLLGKLTFREMLYFTIYHVQHHHVLMLKYLGD